MEKLEIKLTLTADSTPELLRYLRGISSARDRAFILKRLATAGLSILSSGTATDTVLLPSPIGVTPLSRGEAPAAQAGPTPVSAAATAPPVATTDSTAHVAAIAPVPMPAQRNSPAAIVTAPLPLRQDPGQINGPDATASFAFLDLDALNAATAQFG